MADERRDEATDGFSDQTKVSPPGSSITNKQLRIRDCSPEDYNGHAPAGEGFVVYNNYFVPVLDDNESGTDGETLSELDDETTASSWFSLEATKERYVNGETELIEFEDQLEHALEREQRRVSDDLNVGPGFGPVPTATDSVGGSDVAEARITRYDWADLVKIGVPILFAGVVALDLSEVFGYATAFVFFFLLLTAVMTFSAAEHISA